MAEGFGDKFKEFFGLGGVESYEDPYYRDNFEERPERTERHEREDRAAGRYNSDHYGSYRSSERRSEVGSSHGYGSDREHAAAPARSRYGATEREAAPVQKNPMVIRLALNEYNQAREISEALKTGDVVVFNLGGMEKSAATRVLDFAAGLSLGLDAELKKLGGVRNFVLIPHGIELEQSQLDQLTEG